MALRSMATYRKPNTVCRVTATLQNFAAAYDFSSLKWLEFYLHHGAKYQNQLHAALRAIPSDNHVASTDGVMVRGPRPFVAS